MYWNCVEKYSLFSLQNTSVHCRSIVCIGKDNFSIVLAYKQQNQLFVELHLNVCFFKAYIACVADETQPPGVDLRLRRRLSIHCRWCLWSHKRARRKERATSTSWGDYIELRTLRKRLSPDSEALQPHPKVFNQWLTAHGVTPSSFETEGCHDHDFLIF